MNWSKAKNVLIIFFLLINIALVTDIIYSSNKANIITPEIINSTVEVLAKNDISIDTGIIPSKTSSLPYIEVTNIITSPDEFAEQILGNGYSYNSENSEYTKDDNRLTIVGDKFAFYPASPISGDLFADISDKNAVKKAVQVLSDYGINLNKYVSYVESADGVYNIYLTKKVKSKLLFDSKIYISATNQGISHIEGTWFNETNYNSYKNKIQLNNITSVLVEFILNEKRPQSAITINDLQLGYSLGDDNIYHRTMVLIPAWKIQLDDYTCYYVDARESK